MKFTITFVLAILVCASCQASVIFEETFRLLHQEPPPTSSKSRMNITVDWIEQKLDQFNESDTRAWKMRYMANDHYFEKGAPMFIFVGGEWTISGGRLAEGHWHDIGKEHNGYLFYTEHRFYGESQPFSDLETENLKYLNVKQSLADLAHFIRTIKSTTPGLEDSKVVLAGGSYSGTMVTWFKRLYPELIVGAWASSAPLFAKLEFYEYKEVIGQSIKLVGGEACYNRIQNGIAELENMLTNNKSSKLRTLLKICENFDETNDLDVWSLFGQISNIFAGIVQNHRGDDIQATCSEIMKGDDDVIGLSNFLVSFYGSHECLDITYKEHISYLKMINNSRGIYRQWFYQTCNEFGWYHTSLSEAQPFGTKFPLPLNIATCHDVFGDQFTNVTMDKNVDNTNEFFGGFSPEVQNVYFSQGQLDPWHPMGITNKEEATMIPMYAHCKDFGSVGSSDTDEMKASKEKIAELVRIWVGDQTVVDA